MSKYNIAGVYKIENTITGEAYIGQSIDILGRWRTHIRDAWQISPQSGIAKAIKKYGPENFTFCILERYDNTLNAKYLTSLLKKAESRYVKEYDSYYNGYNKDLGGNLGKVEKIKKAF